MAESVSRVPQIGGNPPLPQPQQPLKFDLHDLFTAIGERMCRVRTLKERALYRNFNKSTGTPCPFSCARVDQIARP